MYLAESNLVSIGVIAILVIGFVIWAVFAAKKEAERIKMLKIWLEDQGYSYNDTKDYEACKQYAYLDGFDSGSNRYFELQIRGKYQGRPFLIFDYHYETYSHDEDGNRETDHHHIYGCVMDAPWRFPADLNVRPEHIFDKIGAAVGFNDIDFESAEFSKKFHVSSSDRKFAFDIIHAGMIEYLLEHPSTSFQMRRSIIHMSCAPALHPEEYAELLRHQHHILSLTPDYVIEQMTA